MGLAGVAEVDVGVDKAGRDRFSGRVQDRAARRRVHMGLHAGENAVVADEQVKARIQAGIWV